MITLYDQCFTCRPNWRELWQNFEDVAKKSGVEIGYIKRATKDDFTVASKAKAKNISMPFWLDEDSGKINQSLSKLIDNLNQFKKKATAKNGKHKTP